jgi:hypothetical protein
MIMKKIAFSLLIFSCLFHGSLLAQTGVRFGLKTGLSLATQYGIKAADNTYNVETSSRKAFAGGIFAYFPITKSVGIQQELLYAMKGSGQDVTITTPVNINTVSKYKLNYFEMPIVLKYQFVKIKNVGIYGSTGIALSLLINGEYNIDTTVDTGVPPLIENNESGNMDGIDTFDYSFIYGAGADFKLLNKDFFFEYRMTVGWNTLQMPNASGADPVPLRNQDYVFALGLYF